ncbi:MAG: hypothetical protein FD180_1270 [Planctomycetota bacterium]|nr:MAG: hypothetical protein FD180_1270 [Planctomycetota bacterium]
MNDFAKTGIAASAAVVLASLAALTAPGAVKSTDFGEQGQLFFPEFKDPLAATSLQVVEFDVVTAAPSVFKVEFKGGKWKIPSHHDYPADGKDQLAKTATSLLGIRKDKLQSNRKEDHAACGVLDPEEAGGDGKNKGRRVTLRDAAGAALADLIIGKKADDEGKKYFVRVPGQSRIYAVKMEVDLSTKFGDWIETDLSKIEPSTVWRITLDNYSVVQNGPFLEPTEPKIDTFEKSGDEWKNEGVTATEEVDVKVIGDITGTIDDLKILGVRRKTPAMAAAFRGEGSKITNADVQDLADKGFFYTREDLFSKEGNLIIECEDGVVYEIRFGAVFTGTGIEMEAGGGDAKKDEKKDENKDENKDEKKDEKAPIASEARYLLIVAHFNKKSVKPEKMEDPPKSWKRISSRPWTAWRIEQEAEERRKEYDRALAEYAKTLAESSKRFNERATAGEKRAKQLADRFGDWYYVVGAESFAKLHVKRNDVVKSKKEPEGPKMPPEEDPENHEGHGHEKK